MPSERRTLLKPDRQRLRAKKIFVTLPLSLGYVAFGLRPQSTPPRDRTRLVNPTQTKSQPLYVKLTNRVNLYQERTAVGTVAVFLGFSLIICGDVVNLLTYNKKHY